LGRGRKNKIEKKCRRRSPSHHVLSPDKYFSSRIAYMRWSQAWMFHALSTYIVEEKKLKKTTLAHENLV